MNQEMIQRLIEIYPFKSTKEIADEVEFGDIQNVLLEGLEKFLTEKTLN